MIDPLVQILFEEKNESFTSNLGVRVEPWASENPGPSSAV